MIPLRVLMAGGGTAGHLFPCLAVAEELAELTGDLQVHYVGAQGRVDAQILSERGLPHHLLPARPLPYSLSPAAAAGLIALLRSTLRARGIIRTFRPDVVFSTGGYVGAAVVLAARSTRVPVVLHVSDVLPDRSNRLLARWATAITAAQPEAAQHLRRPVITTGHPVRREVAAMAASVARANARAQYGVQEDQPLLLITGGSQGARTLNYAVLEALPTLLQELGARVVHLCGATDYPELKRLVGQRWGQPQGYELIERVANTGPLLAAADLVVTRAGAASLAEACLFGVPMIIVPYPHAGGHQRYNAEPLVAAGAAVMVEDAEFTGTRLVALARELLGDRERLQAMARAARAAAHPHAARDVAQVVAAAAARGLAAPGHSI